MLLSSLSPNIFKAQIESSSTSESTELGLKLEIPCNSKHLSEINTAQRTLEKIRFPS